MNSALLTDVKGVGPATANLLAAHGIETVEDLAAARVKVLMKIPGFLKLRARAVKTAAKALVKDRAGDERGKGKRKSKRKAKPKADKTQGRKDKKGKGKSKGKGKDKRKAKGPGKGKKAKGKTRGKGKGKDKAKRKRKH